MTLQALPEMASDADDVYEIYQMTYARDLGRRVHDNFVMRDMHDGPMPVDFSLWVVRNAHRTIVIDTGFGPRASAERGRPLDFDPIDGLTRIGVDPAAVTDVVITHLHFDHAGNIDRFDAATLHVQDSEVEFATGRCMCDAFVRRPFDVEGVVTLIRRTYADRVVFHDGDDALFPGLTLHAFPGHTKGVQALRVMTPRGPVVLASDTSHYWANILAMKPFVASMDIYATLRSYREIMALGGSPDRVIPGHDPKVRKLFPAIKVNGIPLLALHLEPAPYDPADLARSDNY